MQDPEVNEVKEFLDNEIRIYRLSTFMIGIPFLILWVPSPTAIDPAWRNETIFTAMVIAIFVSAIVWDDMNAFSRNGKIHENYYSDVPKYYLNAIFLILAFRMIMFLVEIWLPNTSNTISLIGYGAGLLIFIIWARFILKVQKNMINRLEEIKELSIM